MAWLLAVCAVAIIAIFCVGFIAVIIKVNRKINPPPGWYPNGTNAITILPPMSPPVGVSMLPDAALLTSNTVQCSYSLATLPLTPESLVIVLRSTNLVDWQELYRTNWQDFDAIGILDDHPPYPMGFYKPLVIP